MSKGAKKKSIVQRPHVSVSVWGSPCLSTPPLPFLSSTTLCVCARLWMCVWAWLPPPHAMLALATMVQRGWGWGQPQPEYWMGHVIHELKSLCPFLSVVCPPLQRPGAFSICLKRSRCRNPQWTRLQSISCLVQLFKLWVSTLGGIMTPLLMFMWIFGLRLILVEQRWLFALKQKQNVRHDRGIL